ncbi:hypothetical protein PUNSTDRAFT_51732 [Punctularia strigosozonata HHB-11173 SS5]|uniref:uncharacterized protein n=1 Tax=Punctularia strigosozonata (strain HHB-11173) TaxID=741275 RepID=UPI0004417483|nr:uncharacterized protein PUNSTDRAFT_51732 [Punctularia strigosozonata HHB-11173 SS5]EIN09458.1 hypothetical protein PUNSTDRAFT_51732 [Punctularia strigosozonata HHB-11173 SS5]
MASQDGVPSNEISTQASGSRHRSKGKPRGGGQRGGQRSGQPKLRGLPSDSEQVRLSKTLSWLLRHAAAAEGIPMRSDGFVRVSDLLKHEKLRNLDFPTLERLVQDNDKQRYTLVCEPEGAKTGNDIWWIGARQGHSMKQVQTNLKPITSASEIPMAVHGTSLVAWDSIQVQGLSRMKRNHIHMAQGVAGAGVISGMRASSSVLIYVDVQKALDAGIKFYLSENGVVLSEGNEHGFIPPEFFQRVEAKGGKRLEIDRMRQPDYLLPLRQGAKEILTTEGTGHDGQDDPPPTTSDAIPSTITTEPPDNGVQ